MEKRDIRERIIQKTASIREYLDFLLDEVPENIEEYKKSLRKKAICERYIQKIADAAMDLAFFVINLKSLEQPMNEDSVFNILSKEKVIKPELAAKLNNLKGMRNFIIHQYEKIDDSIIYSSLSEEIKDDVEDFINAISNLLEVAE